MFYWRFSEFTQRLSCSLRPVFFTIIFKLVGIHDSRHRDTILSTRFRDLDERWKSASTGRRNRRSQLLRQTSCPARWGRRVRPAFPWPQTLVGIYDEQSPET